MDPHLREAWRARLERIAAHLEDCSYSLKASTQRWLQPFEAQVWSPDLACTEAVEQLDIATMVSSPPRATEEDCPYGGNL